MADGFTFANERDIEDIVRLVRHYRANGWPDAKQNRTYPNTIDRVPILIRNDSGEEIPAFACVQADGTVEAGEQNYIKVVKPTGTSGVFFFNGFAPIADGDYGVAHDGPECRMLTDGSTVTLEDGWQPESGEWAVTPGGSAFIAIGEDDIETNVMRGVIRVAGSGIYRYRLLGAWSSLTANAEILDAEGVSVSASATLRDPLSYMVDQTTGDFGHCYASGTKYYTIQAPCTSASGGTSGSSVPTINPTTYVAGTTV